MGLWGNDDEKKDEATVVEPTLTPDVNVPTDDATAPVMQQPTADVAAAVPPEPNPEEVSMGDEVPATPSELVVPPAEMVEGAPVPPAPVDLGDPNADQNTPTQQ